MNIGILITSDRGARGEYEDRAGPLLRQILEANTSWTVTHYRLIPDEIDVIADTLISWVNEAVHLIFTSGGTGFSPRDVTPEATRRVIEREAPGIAEALRAESRRITQHAMLSRGVAGIRAQTLIINLPGNPKAIRENMPVLLPVLPHALELLLGRPGSESQHRTV
jgi:molybdopterin adenylyltransferase